MSRPHPAARKTTRFVILDLGNVVIDWNVERILEALDFDSEVIDLLRHELFSHSDWIDMDHGKKSEAAVVADVCQRSGLQKHVVETALQVARESLLPITESLALMRDIARNGLPMFCLSNMSRENYAYIRSYELFEMFNGILISGHEGCMKPDEEIFHLALERFGLAPAETLFVDDSSANIETALRLGINGFHFKRSPGCYAGLRQLLF